MVRGIDLTLGRISLQPVVGGTDPTPRRTLLESKSRVGTIIYLRRKEKSDLLN